jgi:nucleoside-diphosphate-sugar epimerase
MYDILVSRTQRVFITGSAGFVGSAVASAFVKSGAEVTGTLHAPSDTERAWKTIAHDWTKPYDRSGEADLLIHGVFDRSLQHNAEMARNAALAARALKAKRAILISSGAVYAETGVEITEESPLAARETASQYAILSQETETKFRENLGDIPLTVVRLFYPYGIGESRERFIPRLIAAIRSGLNVKLRPQGRPRINPIHIDDLSQSVLKIAESVSSKDASVPVINLGGPEIISVENLARLIGEKTDVEVLFQEADDDFEAKDFFCSTRALERLTGFKPRVGMAEGIARLLSN